MRLKALFFRMCEVKKIPSDEGMPNQANTREIYDLTIPWYSVLKCEMDQIFGKEGIFCLRVSGAGQCLTSYGRKSVGGW